ncbi:response regulator [Flammeovirga sp. SJP92]|uniref:response regulator n=1 Tax=Flammeovirga sp. SJP92 TaxID=1775430 RepID=UPI000788BE02|nr:response regulator [Flammeovirga sp. SJP92]KXX66687.1 fused response regulator/thioredoxin-disulfide reductase [Flammeovirga sp. SJP92]
MDKKPILLLVDDDPQVLQAVKRDMRNQYKKEYKILATDSANEALDLVTELRNKGDEIALFLSDQRMPEMQGVDFLEKVKAVYPNAGRVLLTAYSDTDAAIKSINDAQIDYYLLKPWDPPEEKLYPVIDDILSEWHAKFQPTFKGIRVMGYPFSKLSHDIKDFLAANLIPYQWLDVTKDEEAQQLVANNNLTSADLPVVVMEDGNIIRQPAPTQLASNLGFHEKAKEEVYDVVIIGAGPAGLAAAVYGGSEGLKTLLIEKKAPGGQAGTSSRIENYLGFPKGLSGQDLARRAITQATRFGIEFLNPKSVNHIDFVDKYKVLTLDSGETVKTKSVVLTTGVDYRKLMTEGLPELTGAGVYYGAATTEANACKDSHVFVVGGGNSAGQGAMYLSQFSKQVSILIRREDLSSTMSQYLIDQIDATPNIDLKPFTQIVKGIGDEKLESLVIENMKTKEQETYDARAVFIFIGAKPYTDWLPENVNKDEKGFVITGRDLNGLDFKKYWKEDRDPFLLETSVPGIFAAGDVRSGAMNRVASAVGEGAMSISLVHKYLSEY